MTCSSQVRKLGCELLLRLSQKCNMPKLIQRNVDVLCQLLSLIEGDKAHLIEIAAAIREHFVCFPLMALNVLFAKNLRPLREETGEWDGPCLAVVREQIQTSSANRVELDVALCKCIQDEWSVRRCKRDVKPSDVQLFLSLAGQLKLNWTKPPTASLASQVGCYLSGLSGLILNEILILDSTGKYVENAALSAPAGTHPCSPGASMDELRALLTMTLCICNEYTAGGSRIAAFTKLLHGLLPARENATHDVVPPLLHLPSDSITCFLRQLCIFAISNSSCFSFDAAQLRCMQEALAWTLEVRCKCKLVLV